MGAELFLEDRQTDIANLIVTFRSFAKAPKLLSSEVCRESLCIFGTCKEVSPKLLQRTFVAEDGSEVTIAWHFSLCRTCAGTKDAKGTVYTRRNCANWGEVATLLPRMSTPNLGKGLEYLDLARLVSNPRVTCCPQHSAM